MAKTRRFDASIVCPQAWCNGSTAPVPRQAQDGGRRRAARIQATKAADANADAAPPEGEIDEAVYGLCGLDERDVALIGAVSRP